ncbi:MAG: hypothetical protein V4732_00095 [Pseudomonadota bacterium]
MDNNMKNISVRLAFVDIQRIKELSTRLGVRESDLFRFSVKNILEKLVLLNDKNVKGADLIPIWLECGDFLMDHFDLDINKLNEIFNLNVTEPNQRIDMEDIELMAMSKLNPIYMIKKLSALCKKQIDPNRVNEIFREYLYSKYILESRNENQLDVRLATA